MIGTPSFFGNYLNMARHNAYMVIKHLSEKYKLERVFKKKGDGSFEEFKGNY